MKKLTRLTIAVVMTFGLVACDSQDKKESADARSVEEVVAVLGDQGVGQLDLQGSV